jgi:hypothetical protein
VSKVFEVDHKARWAQSVIDTSNEAVGEENGGQNAYVRNKSETLIEKN